VTDDAARARSARLAALAAVSVVVVVVGYLFAVRTHLGQRLDDVAFARRSAVTAATTRRTDRFLGTVSAASLFGVGAAIVLVALARRRVTLAIAAATAMAGAVLTTEVLKLKILTRPNFGEGAAVAYNTFPSGHSTIGMALSLGMVMVAPVRLRRVAVLVAAFTSIAFGTAVLVSGWHRPSDVVSAYFVAFGWFCAVSAVHARFDGRRSTSSPAPADGQVSVPFLLAAATGVFALLMFALWKSLGASGLRTVVYAAPYVAACIGIDIAGIAVVGAYYVVGRTSPDVRSVADRVREVL